MTKLVKTKARPTKKAVQKRSQDTQKRFIQATLKLAAKRPMHLVTSKSISEEAGTAWGSAQYLFGSKEGLMVAAVRHASETFIKLCEKEFARNDYRKEDLENVIDFFWNAVNKSNMILAHDIAISCLHDKEITEIHREIILKTLDDATMFVSVHLGCFYQGLDVVRLNDMLLVIETIFTGLHVRRNFTRPEITEQKLTVLKKLWIAELALGKDI
ncbi:MAG: TetR/AcrR family transcriptional regulator [Kordiimonadaceae bacterium]|nr:TetR/AcrR family transcriptional regulator [Kordiimonadaceae bacterium]